MTTTRIFTRRPVASIATKAAAWIAAAMAFGVAVPAAASPWQANEDDALILELHSGAYKLGDTLRGYQTPSGVCVDLADLIQTLDLPVRLDKKSRRATGWLFAEDQRFTLDREANTVQTVNVNGPLADGAVYDTPEGWCASLNALSGWFGVRFRADLGNLSIRLESDRKLPFLEAIERKNRAARLNGRAAEGFDLAKLPQADTPYKDWRTPSVDVTLQVQRNNRLAGGSGLQMQYEVLASGEVLGASFEARLASDRKGVPASLRLRAYRNDPTGNLLGMLKATQVGLGDVQTYGGALTAQSGYGRGAFVTNQPLGRSSRFSTTTLRGSLPTGWDAELYRNGVLRAFQSDRGDGRYEFPDIELLFGENDFEVVLYGPQGQLKRERSSVPIGLENLKPGKTMYWAGVVEDHQELIDFKRNLTDPLTGWRWGVGVEHGIDQRTTAGLEMQSFVKDGKRHSYLEATVNRTVGPAVVQLAGAQQFGAGQAVRVEALGKLGAVRFQAETLWINGDYDSELILPGSRGELAFNLQNDLKIGQTVVPVQLGARRSLLRNGRSATEWFMRGSLGMRGLLVTTQLSHRSSAGPNADRTRDGLHLDLLGNTSVSGIRLRGGTRFQISGINQGFESATFSAERRLDEDSELRGSFDYYGDSDRGDFRLAYVRQFKRFALRSEAKMDTAGGFGLGLSLQMSFGPDPVDGGWRVSRERLAQEGQAFVEVYRDENGDGFRQPGEEGVEGVSIEAGFKHSERVTDKRGRTMVDGLRPYQPVLVGIDTGSLPDPLLQPKGRGMVVVPRAGVTAQLSLPLAPTGEIEATLLGADGQPAEGVTIELVESGDRVVARAVSEFDGYVLFDSIPYGTYRLRIAPASAAALGVRDELGAPIRIDRAQGTARIGTIRLEAGTAPTVVAALP